MKPQHQNRSRSYYRHHRRRVINRKMNITKSWDWNITHSGYFAKGKIHCSCYMCSSKTNRNGYPISQLKHIESMNSQIYEYFNEERF